MSQEKAIGEASPQYLTWPDAPRQIKAHIPDAKLVAILRQPVARAISGYAFRYARGIETVDFESAIKDDLAGNRSTWRGGRLFNAGLYYEHLSRYYRLFPRDQIMVVLYEDFVRDALAVMQSVYHFLGVEDQFRPNVAVRHNATPTIHRLRLKELARSALHAVGLARTPAQRSAPPVPPAVRAWLVNLYHDDIIALQALIGRDLSHWLHA